MLDYFIATFCEMCGMKTYPKQFSKCTTCTYDETLFKSCLMSKLVFLEDYMKKDVPMIQDVRVNLDKLSLYTSHNTLRENRSIILNSLPNRSLNIKKLFVPFSYDGEPFWLTNIEQGYFNHKYEPYTMLMYVLRDHYREVFDYCDGILIDSQRDYQHYQDMFNDSFVKTLEKAQRGSERACSVDDMIRMGSLFLILLRACDNSDGLVIDYDRRFVNVWSGIRTSNKFLLSHLKEMSERLKDVYMSGMHWQGFIFRYINETDRDSLWFFNLPEIEKPRTDDLEQEISKDEMFSMFDSILAINNRGGKILMSLGSDDKNIQFLKEYFSFKAVGGGVYRNTFLSMNQNNDEGLIIISNYRIAKDKKRVTS